jgi:hypothetical protein
MNSFPFRHNAPRLHARLGPSSWGCRSASQSCGVEDHASSDHKRGGMNENKPATHVTA